VPDRAPKSGRILIVDDQEANVLLLERLLRAYGYTDVHSTSTSLQAPALCAELRPDLLLLDLHMPGLDGYGVMDRLASAGGLVPIIVLSADITTEAKRRALSMGASDFVAKPFDHLEVLLRVKTLLESHRLRLELEHHNDTLERQVRERTADLEQTRLEILHRLALAGEYRDDATQEHARRLGRTAALLADRLGLPRASVRRIGPAATLHDIGKIGIPDSILLKPGGLTPDEFAVMKRHVAIGAQLLSGSRAPLLTMAEEIAATHHERWDGSGYPRGLAGEEIPIAGRIAALADVFDVLTHARPYKQAWPLDQALGEVRTQAGRHFDPRVVGAFETLDHAALLEPVGDDELGSAEDAGEPASSESRTPPALQTLQRVLAQAGRTMTPTAAVLVAPEGPRDREETWEAISQTVRSAVRQSDVVTRCEDGMLLLVLSNTNRAGALRLTETLRTAISRTEHSGGDGPLTARYGVAAVPEDAGDAAQLLHSAILALSQQRSGRAAA